MKKVNDKTIAAISTPPGKGGIAVIRISGSDAIAIGDRMFKPKNGKKLSELDSAKMIYGDILYNGIAIDDGLASVFFSPHSYTGEDTVEINCHGGILLANKVLESAFLCGAEQASPGEFTKRAFLSGNISLTEAEAIAELIDAQSEGQLTLASSNSHGVLSCAITELYNRLSQLVAKIYVDIEYPGEDLVEFDKADILEELLFLINDIEKLSGTYQTGRAVAHGVSVVICGKPNTGKSSLMNMLLGKERAIVTSEAGTTRDIIEETVEAGCVLLRISDTAGIRKAENEAEKIGVEKTVEKIKEAELVLAVFDISSRPDGEDEKFIDELKSYLDKGGKAIGILNKSDLNVNKEALDRYSSVFEDKVIISAANKIGREEILKKAESLYIDGSIDIHTDAIAFNARQYASLCNAVRKLRDAYKAIEEGIEVDICGTDMELALASLGQTDGRTVTEDIVANIFSRFCVGK